MQRNLLTLAQDSFWFGYLQWCAPFDAPPETAEPWARELSNRAFLAGARWATRQESALSPYIAQFIHMMVLLGYLDDNSPLFASYQDSEANGYQTEVPY